MNCACGNPITRHSKTGNCRPCAARITGTNPEVLAKRGKAISAMHRNPEFKAKFSASLKAGYARKADDPAHRAKMDALGRIGAANVANCHTPEAKARKRAALVPWCPPELLDFNTQLRKQGIRQAERKRIVREMIPGTEEYRTLRAENAKVAMSFRHARDLASRY